MQLALTFIGFILVLINHLLISIFNIDLSLADNAEWTICYILGATVAWLGVRDSDKWKIPRILLALSLTANALGQIIWDIQLYYNDRQFPGVSDYFFLLTGVFLLACAIQSVNTIHFRESRKTLFLDATSISLILTIVILSVYLPHKGIFDYNQLITITIYPILIFSAACILVFIYFTNGREYTPARAIFLIGCIGLGACWLEWNDRFLKNHLIDGAILNRLFSISILMLGYGGSKWSLTENLDTPSFSFSLRFLPVVKVSIASIIFIFIWNDTDTTLSLKILAAIGTAIIFIFASLRQMLLIQEKVEAESKLKALNQSLEEKVAHRTKELQESVANLTETQSQLVLSEKLASIGQLVGNITHEINTPLSAIFASSGTIKLLLTEKFDSALHTFRGLTEKEVKVFQEIFSQSSRSMQSFDSKSHRTRAKDMVPVFENKNFDIRTITELLSDFGYDRNSIPQVLIDMEENKIEAILETVKLFTDIIRASEIIHQSTHRSDRLIKSLKSYLHQVDQTNKEEINLFEHLKNLVFLYYGKYQDRVKINLEIPNEILLYCYVDELNQVWANLINNSLDAMNHDGEISISAKQIQDFVEILLEDNGPGISKEVQPKIFDAFFTTKKVGEGTGLGLAITKSIIEKHNGSIDFESNSNGTKFIIRLPKII